MPDKEKKDLIVMHCVVHLTVNVFDTLAPAPYITLFLCKCRYILCTPGYQINFGFTGQKFSIETKERIGLMGNGLATGITPLSGGLNNLVYYDNYTIAMDQNAQTLSNNCHRKKRFFSMLQNLSTILSNKITS